jgi:hypothetical protein
LVEGGHTNTFYDPVVSDATYGMRFDNDASGTAPNNNTIINVNASRNSDAGLYFAHGGSTVVIGGTSEGNKGAGVLIGASFDNVFIGLDLESNGTYDYDVSGSGNTLSGGSDGVIIRSGAYENTITGQTGGTITLSNGSEWTRVVNAQVSANPSDSGAYDVFDNVFNFSTRAWLPTKKVAQTFSTLPTCTSGVSGIEGSMAPVTDSTTSTWGATITGGGSNHVLAYCDGSNWTVAAK